MRWRRWYLRRRGRSSRSHQRIKLGKWIEPDTISIYSYFCSDFWDFLPCFQLPLARRSRLESMGFEESGIWLPELCSRATKLSWLPSKIHSSLPIIWKLFELLVLSSALLSLHGQKFSVKGIYSDREVFVDFDPVLVSKLNEKKIIAPGSTASSLLSEPKLRAIIKNAHEVLKEHTDNKPIFWGRHSYHEIH